MGGKSKPELLEIPGAEGLSVDYFKELMGKVSPTRGIAGMSGAEQTTQDLLSKFLGTSATEGEGYKLGMGEIKKTLGGEFYDPTKSDFWKGFRDVSAMEQEKGVADIRRRGQLGGGLYADPSQRTESDFTRAAGAERSMMLGGLYEKERGRKESAVGQALGYAGFEEQGKMSRLQAGSTIGALPREIEQSKKTADYMSELLTEQSQTGAAERLMPQWNVDQGGGDSGAFGMIGTIVSALIGK